MTEVQNFMLVVCFGCTMGFLIGTFSIMVSDGLHYLKKRRRKKKSRKNRITNKYCGRYGGFLYRPIFYWRSAMKNLEIDIETFSSVDLAKAGVYRYVESPDFEVLLFGYSIDGQDVKVVDLANGERIPKEILNALEDEAVTKWAFNAQFERICISRMLGYEVGTYLAPDSWKCSMVWSAYMGLPLSLEGVGVVLGLEKQKLTEGKELIRYFCTPCKPTKSNGNRVRNLPFHDMEKWEKFKAYNIRDVETEMQIQKKLLKFPVPEFVWDEYHLDQEINDRGILVDVPFVEKCMEIDKVSREHLMSQMQELTSLENPNSVAQMKKWLFDNGIKTETLGKKAVAALIDEVPDEMSEVLSLRQKLAKSSVRKYQAMQNSVCGDGRVRGMFQFYGANRTGRFAGRLVQLQNLPQNHMEDLAEARGLVRSGNYEAIELLYDDIPDTLSQLIRTSFIPPENKTFIVADFSAIEARVIAWFAGENWRKDVFARGGRYLLRIGKSDVWHSCGKAWCEQPSSSEGQDCGACIRVWRFGWGIKINGCH